MSENIKLQPFVSRGEPVMRNNGDVEMVPVQLFVGSAGGYIFRIGQTTLWFNQEGVYDGTEHKMPDHDTLEESGLEEMLLLSAKNRGFAPAQPYFQPGDPGYEAETAGWENHYEPEGEPETYTLEAQPSISDEEVVVHCNVDQPDNPKHGWIYTTGMVKYGKPELEMRRIPGYMFDVAQQILRHVARLILNTDIDINAQIETGPASRLTFIKSEPLPGAEELYEDDRWTIVDPEDIMCETCGECHPAEVHQQEEHLLLSTLGMAFPELKDSDMIIHRLIELGLFENDGSGFFFISDEARDMIRRGEINEITKMVATDWDE